MTKRLKLTRRIFGDVFANHILEDRALPADAEVSQLVGGPYLLPAFLLSIPVGKNPDNTVRKDQYVMQGATIRVHHLGLRLQGFVEQARHSPERPKEDDRPGIFRREEWDVPLTSVG